MTKQIDVRDEDRFFLTSSGMCYQSRAERNRHLRYGSVGDWTFLKRVISKELLGKDIFSQLELLNLSIAPEIKPEEVPVVKLEFGVKYPSGRVQPHESFDSALKSTQTHSTSEGEVVRIAGEVNQEIRGTSSTFCASVKAEQLESLFNRISSLRPIDGTNSLKFTGCNWFWVWKNPCGANDCVNWRELHPIIIEKMLRELPVDVHFIKSRFDTQFCVSDSRGGVEMRYFGASPLCALYNFWDHQCTQNL